MIPVVEFSWIFHIFFRNNDDDEGIFIAEAEDYVLTFESNSDPIITLPPLSPSDTLTLYC